MTETKNWVERFVDYTDNLPSPLIFRKWSALSAIAGVMEQKIWLETSRKPLFATLYVILVAPPGVGKSMVTSIVQDMWHEIPDQHMASTSVTKASLIDDLREAERVIIRPTETPSTKTFHSIKILSNELGVLIPAYDSDFMSVLTDIFDGALYSERRRTKDLNFSLARPQINLLAGTTPSYLAGMLPEGAWDQGFLSRTMLVYSGVKTLVPLFGKNSSNKKGYNELLSDLKKIARAYGRISFNSEAEHAFTEWQMAGGPPVPDHPKLHNYLNRRAIHLAKLCMVYCMADLGDKIVTLDHYQQALATLIEMEHFIPDIFKAMSSGGDAKVIEETWYFTFKLYAANKKPIAEHKIINFLQQRVPAHSISHILTVMEKAGLLKAEIVKGVGTAYVPRKGEVQ